MTGLRRVAALLLVVLTAYVVRQFAARPEARAGALAVGFALIAAALAGELFERARLPRISGYLVFGLVCGPYMADLISRPMARELQLVNGLAVALIAFVAGLEINFARLLPRLASLVRMSAVTLGTVYAAVFALVAALWPWLPIAPDAGPAARVGMATVVTALVVSFSPTVTIAVITESRARGPLSELVLAVVVLADLALIVAFSLAMQFARWSTGAASPGDVSLLARLGWEIFGSVAFGAAVGAAFAFYLRAIGREVTVALLALCALLAEGGGRLHLEPLLAALSAGLVVENVAPPEGDALKDAVERGALPVLILFFAAAGASIHLDALAAVGMVAIGLSLARIVFIRVGTAAGAWAAGIPPGVGRLAWMGFVSQAGVTLGLAIVVAAEYPDWGTRAGTLVVALVALHELIGPILFRAALVRAGEVGRMEGGPEPSAAPA